MHPKVLIVGTVPYNRQSTSRAFDAYFHNWEKQNLRQVFSNTKKPAKGHCGSLFQITDYRILERWKGKKCETGVEYKYEELEDSWVDNDLEIDSKSYQNAYKVGRMHNSATHFLRGILWRKKFWCTPKFNKWLEEFSPDCVFLSFSDDYFILEIALYVAKKFNIPIISSIGDDYYFNIKFSISPLYYIYKFTYRKLVRKVLSHKGSAIYISDKIKKKYEEYFSLGGETVYLISEISRKPFRFIDTKSPVITYFGNIRMGRNYSLNDIANALSKIDKSYVLEVYSNEIDDKHTNILKRNENIKFCGSVPYAQVMKRMYDSDITVIVEGFEKKDINLSRFSLSTKAADSLASGVAILTYGSRECGVVEYMESTNASAVCTKLEHLEKTIRQLLYDQGLQKRYYENAIFITEKHHNIDSSCKTFENIVSETLGRI